VRNGEWVVVSADVESREARVLAKGRQAAWGQPEADVVPLYGPHWAPGEHRDLELLNVRTGEIRTVVTADAVKAKYAKWVGQQFGDQPISVFFPILSPDLNRVLLKIASPAGGGFRSRKDSKRCGLLCYDIKDSRFLSMHPNWGHPGWLPDSQRILNIWGQGPVRIDCETGAVDAQPNLPAFRGGHPSVAPDGRLFTADCLAPSGGAKGQWQVVVGDFHSGGHLVIRQFDNSKGASSWRRSHPHPVFSPDGRRIYFNVSSGPWTRLHVAESAGPMAAR
jgi:transposase